jgi:hypothetical protein
MSFNPTRRLRRRILKVTGNTFPKRYVRGTPGWRKKAVTQWPEEWQ